MSPAQIFSLINLYLRHVPAENYRDLLTAYARLYCALIARKIVAQHLTEFLRRAPLDKGRAVW